MKTAGLSLVLAALVSCLAGCARQPCAYLSVQAVDGFTDRPVANAFVVIPETGETFAADESGRTALMSVPAVQDTHFQGVQPQEWGTVTVLVYAEGYYTVALFHCRVEVGKTRRDLRIRLFPDDGTLREPFSLVESPDDDWVRALLLRFAPSE